MKDIVFITPKFWPDKENRRVPLDKDVDYENPYEVLKHRQKVRLFYLNWVQVWRTYVYYSKWAIGIVPLVFLLTKSFWAAAIALAAWIVCRFYFLNKLKSITKFKILAMGILDRFIIPHLGYIEPFE
ncbi:MAG TPA: hypothetical protein PK563_11815 [Tenuifilaceae bacterium]|nr:hypothetical protein [Tenuifilaceae bacterium]